MLKYLKIIYLFWTTSISAEMEYRLNFVLAALTSLGNLVGSLFGLFLFYRTGYNFKDWNAEEALIVVGLFTFFQGFSSSFLTPNLNKIVTQVQSGTLDFVLLKPISSQFWLSTRTVSPWGLTDILFSLILIIYSGSKLHLPIINYLFSLIPLTFAMIILYSLWFMLGTTSIWFVKIYNVTEVLRGLLDAGRFPMVAYPVAYRFFFTFIIPVAFLTTIPAEVMLGRHVLNWVFSSGFLAFILLLISNNFWRLALRFYTSASS